MTALHTAQQTEAAPIGYRSRFLQPEQTSWLCAPKFRKVTSLKIIASLQKLKTLQTSQDIFKHTIYTVLVSENYPQKSSLSSN